MDDVLHKPIYRFKIKAKTLMDTYPPRFFNENKKIVHSISCPTGCIYNGELIVSRWHTMPLPQSIFLFDNQTELNLREDYFGYEPSQNSNQIEWYLNFAHRDIFCAYEGSLFAQDEMQVAEHPALGSLREAMLDKNI